MLAIINNPDDEQFEEMMDWVGEDFDPEEFDLAKINAKLKRMQNKKRTIKQDAKL